MKSCIQLLIYSLLLSSIIFGQENQSSPIKVSLTGFVKTDFIYDTRETVNAREGHFLLFPAPEKLDVNGNDINANPNFNILSIQSRLRVGVSGPEILNAKTSAVIEGAFFGHSNSDINGFRLRHAFLKLDWKNNSLIAGQYWHPLFIEEVFPGVVSFNTGVPFMPFSRNPQLRVSQDFGGFRLSLTLASQRDFGSAGPNGTSSEYLRNSAVPITNLNIKYYGENFLFGGGVNYQTLQPELETDLGIKSDATISSLSFIGFGKYKSGDFTVKLFGTYGENLFDLLMLGGYGVSDVNPATEIETYTNIKTASVWSEFIYGDDIVYGLFAGYTKNLGSDEEIAGDIFTRGSNINAVFRLSPRVEFNFDQLRFSLELEYTSAAYGTPNNKLNVENSEDVNNLRVLTGIYYFFK